MNFILRAVGRRGPEPRAAPSELIYRPSENPGVERVDVRDPEALAQWSARLGVSQDHLVRAVIVVGERLPDVRHQLAIEGS